MAEVGLIDPGRGEMRYALEGWSWVVAQRRKRALRQIARLCEGRGYDLLRDFASEDVEVPYSQDPVEANLKRGTSHYSINPFQHLQFECLPEKP